MMSSRGAIMIIMLFAVCALLYSAGGCSGSGSSESNVLYDSSGSGASSSPTPSSIYPPSAQVTSYYFPASLVSQMKSDAAPIISSYEGLNVFSTSMYAKAFIEGTVTVKDIFDARIPVNYQIFCKYAYDNFGVRLKPMTASQMALRDDQASPSPTVSPSSSPSPSPSSTPYYLRYAAAANQFIADFEYDGILFRPDELHPIFTNPDTDTWLFLVDHPTNSADIYYSTRVQNRSIGITGGLAMRAMNTQDPLYTEDWMYYVPNESVSNYSPFVKSSKCPCPQQKLVSATSNYVPQDASAAALARRSQYGIVPSSLSNSTLRVGGWKNQQYIQDMVTNGISFTNAPTSGTWGGWGLYLLPLRKDFWE